MNQMTTPEITGTINQTPEEIQAGLIQGSIQPRTFGSTPVGPDDSPSTWDVVKAAFQRENLVTQFLRHGGVDPTDDTENWNRDFNVYTYFKVFEDEYEDIKPYILRGDFEDIYTEEAFQRLVNVIRESRKNAETIEQGGFTGVAASMAAGILDAPTLIPVAGWASRGGKAVAALRTGALVGGTVAATEAGLQYFDPARTNEESFLNIGVATALGAGLGGLLAPSLKPRPGNALDVDVNPGIDGRVDMRPGAEPVVTTAEEAQTVSKYVNDSVGAMRVNSTDGELLRSTNPVAQGLQKAVEWTFNRFTPLSRSYGWLPGARGLMLKMADNGGLYTRGMLRGQSLGGVMEDRMMAHRANVEDTLETMRRTFIRLNMELGQSKAGAVLGEAAADVTGKGPTKLPRDVFWAVVRKRLVLDKHLADGYRDGQSRYDAALKKVADDYGLDEKGIAAFSKYVEEAAQVARKSFSELADTVVRSGVMDPDLRLGDGYGLPVIYKKGMIDADPAGFERIMREWLVDNPPEEWLEANGHADWMREQGYKTWSDVPLAERDSILAQWQGDKEATLLDSAAKRLESASAALLKAETLTQVIEDGLTAAQKENKSLKARLLRKEAARVEADYLGRKLAWAEARAAKAAERVRSAIDDGVDFDQIAEEIRPKLEESGLRIDQALEEALARKGGANEARDIVRRLRGQRLAMNKAKEPDAEALARNQAEIDQAIVDWSEAVQIRKEAEAELSQAAKTQRDLMSFNEKVAKAKAQHLTDMQTQRELDGIGRSLEMVRERAADLRLQSQKLDDARKALADEIRLIRQGRQVANKELRAARKEYTQARRLNNRLAKAVPLNQYLQDLTTKLRSGDQAPNGILIEDAALNSGRLKARKFKLSPDAQEKLEAAGFLETDLGLMLRKSWRELGGMDAAQRTFGTTKVEDLLRDVDVEYDSMITAARDAGNTKLAESLTRQRLEAREDLTTVWNRVTGRTYLGGDGPEVLVQGSRMLRSVAYMGIAGGITLSAFADLGTALLSTRGFFPGLVKHARSYRKLIENAKSNPESARQLRALLASMETSGHITMSGHMEVAHKLDDVGLSSSTFGAGMAKVNDAMSRVGDKVNILSGLRLVSDTIRRTAALVQMNNLVRWVDDYAALPEKIKVELASYGVGEQEAQMFRQFFRKYGFDEVDGLKVPRIDAWKAAPNGDYVRDVFNGLLIKTQRRASLTAGAGALPGAMDNWVGSILLQFQSYAFQFATTVLIGSVQRGLTVDAVRPLLALGVTLSMTALTAQIRASMRGDDTSTWDNSKWAREIIDRSGLYGYYGAAVDAFSKVAGPTINDALGAEVFGVSSKYRANDWINSLLGPWTGVLRTAGGATSDVIEGEYDKAFDKAYRLIPLNQFHQAITALGEAMDN